MKTVLNETVWCEKYRPQTVEDCILEARLKTEFTNIVETGDIPNMLLYGPAGSGKTTAARAICEETGVDYIVINTSNERGIDTLRQGIDSFASTVSLGGSGKKCVILDEFDHATPLLQAALRAATESYSNTCSFILTANYPNKIIAPLHSRFVGIDFQSPVGEAETLSAMFFMRVCDILENEGVEYDEEVLVSLVQRFYPDNRRIINSLQQYARNGAIDTGILMVFEEVSIDMLLEAIKNKKFKDIIQWCADNSTNDTSLMYDKIYQRLTEFVDKSSITDAIYILNEGQKSDSIVASKELHLAAVATELMTTCNFK